MFASRSCALTPFARRREPKSRGSWASFSAEQPQIPKLEVVRRYVWSQAASDYLTWSFAWSRVDGQVSASPWSFWNCWERRRTRWSKSSKRSFVSSTLSKVGKGISISNGRIAKLVLVKCRPKRLACICSVANRWAIPLSTNVFCDEGFSTMTLSGSPAIPLCVFFSYHRPFCRCV
jgi:hypothetical protein